MADTLIVNGIVVTIDGQRRVIEDGAVAIEKDRIVAVGSTAEVTTRHSAPKVIDARGKAVMPGLVDGHAHAGHGLIKTMGGGNGALWYQACETVYTVASTEAFWHAEAKLAALERLKFGVTTGVSLLGGGDTIMRTDEPAYGAAHCAGVVEVGTRSVVAVGSTRPPHPRRYARWQGGSSQDRMVTFADQLATCRTLIDDWHDTHGGRIRIALITPTLRDEHVAELGAEMLGEAKAQAVAMRTLSRDRGLVFTQDGHTTGSVKFAHALGLLGPDALLSHATGLTGEEVAICAETDTRIVHNPSAVAAILARCPVTELMEAGVTVCIGSDATAPDRSGDLFRHMQQCMHYHRTFHRDPSWLPPGKTLEMVTIDAARALGLDAEIGSLEVGKKADVVLVDLRRPHLYPFNMPVFRLVYFANGNDVHTVIVDGEVVLEDRKPTRVDEGAVLDEAQRETELMLERTGFRSMLDTPDGFWGTVRAGPEFRD
ncbi:amidohydrolase family protein [Thalassobaculum sp.]|uniref:amidohydrolase family protein n=1 Tax=Thalassobaculum sp. TaxID=2022740 RepID=UPI0032EB12FE